MNKLIAIAFFFLLSAGMEAQIDRSKQPEPGPAPEINLGKPETFSLDNGLKVLVVEDHKLPRVAMTLTMDNPPHAEGNKAGVSSLLGGMLGEGTKDIPKDEFNEEIDYLGANVSFYSTGASANTLSKYFPRILELMAKGALNPRFTEEEFEVQKERTLENLRASEKDVSANASKISRALAFGKEHPYGEFATEETLSALTLEDVRKYYNHYFVPQNAYLVVVGDVETDEVEEMVSRHFSSWEKTAIPTYEMPEVSNLPETRINFVDFPNAVQSEIQVTNTIELQKNDPDYFPLLIANQILGGGGEARLFLNLREDKGYTYGAYSSTGSDKYVARFVASASVRNEVTDSAVIAFLDELHRIREAKVTPEELEMAKAKYTGDFVRALENPSTIARYALNIETENLPEDFYRTYLQKIEAVTAADIQRVANAYYLADQARIVVVGKGSEVAQDLENLTYQGKEIPVLYFNKDADPMAAPDYDQTLAPGMTAEKVLEAYIQAIGGEEAAKKVESVYMTATGEVQGQQLDLSTKVTSSGKSLTEVSVGGNIVQQQIFNGEEGFVMAQGTKIPFTEEQMIAARAEAHPFPEMNAKNATLEGLETVEGREAYAIRMNETTVNYYDKESGLKLQTIRTVKQGPQTMTVTINFQDYQEVAGVKFPFTLVQNMGPMTIDFKVNFIKVNQEVSEGDFQ